MLSRPRRQKLRRSISSSLALSSASALFLLFVACGSDDEDPGATGAEGGIQGTAGEDSGGSTSSTKGGRASKGGATGTGNEGGAASPGGASGTGGAMGEAGADGDPDVDEGADGPGYDGVDLDSLGLTQAPPGCAGGFDPAAGSLEISLSNVVPAVILSVDGVVVTANGVPCESESGAPANLDEIATITIAGSSGDNSLYIDAAAFSNSPLLAASAGFEADLDAGNDQLVIFGSDEKDTIYLGTNDDSLIVDLSGDQEEDISVLGAERVVVTSGPKADVIFADGGALGLDPVTIAVELWGGGANDRLLGGAGDDELHGGIGNDTLLAGTDAGGADVYDGGDGTDTVDYTARTADLGITLSADADDGEADENDDVQPSVENVRGGQGKNHLVGSVASNELWGGPADDVIEGGDGSDFLYGGDGNDTIDGGTGDDYIYGEAGDDELFGSEGDDLLNGYPGVNSLDGGAGDGDICASEPRDTSRACEL